MEPVAPDQPGGAGRKPSPQDRQYTWQDGDRTLTVLLQPDLAVTQDGDILLRGDTALVAARGNAVDKAVPASLPVFRTHSGALMTLPGGVLLALHESWDVAETDAFFADHGIDPDRVSRLDHLANGFFVETEPGWESLELANALAGHGGVRVSSPNWRREYVVK